MGPLLHPLDGIGGVQLFDFSCSCVYCDFDSLRIVLTTNKHLENIPIGNKKHNMSIHNIEPSCPLSIQELVSCEQLLLLSVDNTNLRNSKSQYTQEHEKSQTEHHQSRIRDVAEDPNLVPIVTGGSRTFCN